MSDLLLQAQEALQRQGGRMTNQRRLILETLVDLDIHPTAEDLYNLTRQSDPSINLSTVYRTLRWLLDENLIQFHAFEEDRYHKHFDLNPNEEHYHFLCTSCNTVLEFDSQLVERIKTSFEDHTGAEVLSGDVFLYGLCAQCRKEEADR
jgi:Fe2+ or Zn2+ uptake regulation protein